MWLYLSGSDPSPTAKSTPIVKQCYYPECDLFISRMHPYGLILLPSLRPNLKYFGDLSISYTEDSHARISALQDLERAWQESEADCFSRSCAWPKKSSPRSYSLKTCLPSQAVGDYASLEKLPKWGMTVGGVAYPLLPLERATEETDGSVWLGTPTASESTKGRSKKFWTPNKLPTPNELIQMWPTPTTMDSLPPRSEEAMKKHFEKHRPGRKAPSNLREWIHPQMWPTPTARDATRNKGGSPSDCNRHTPNLPTAILKMVATPTASQANKPIRTPSPSRQKGEHGEDIPDSIGRLNPENIGKRLCPLWVSVLMGYPTTWLDLDASVMQWLLDKRKKRSKS